MAELCRVELKQDSLRVSLTPGEFSFVGGKITLTESVADMGFDPDAEITADVSFNSNTTFHAVSVNSGTIKGVGLGPVEIEGSAEVRINSSKVAGGPVVNFEDSFAGQCFGTDKDAALTEYKFYLTLHL